VSCSTPSCLVARIADGSATAVRVQNFPRLGVIAGLHVAATVALVRGDAIAAEGLWLRALQLIAGVPDGYLAANIYAGLSRSATLAGRYDEGAARAQHGLDLLRAQPAGRGRRRRLLISALHNQAGVALRLGGRLEEARAAYDEALDGLRRAGRLRSARAAAVYHNLGGLAFAQQRHADAERLARHAVRINRRSLPPAPLRVAADVGMLGAIVAAAGRLEEGERLLRDALAVFERRLGPTHREIALALGNLAEVRRARGDDKVARAMAERALMIGQDTLGHQHPELAPIINTLSLASQADGDSAEAMRVLACTAAWLQRAVDLQHPTLLACHHNLQADAVDTPFHA
jgi:tetratricopeptide (TPR) repeat protein